MHVRVVIIVVAITMTVIAHRYAGCALVLFVCSLCQAAMAQRMYHGPPIYAARMFVIVVEAPLSLRGHCQYQSTVCLWVVVVIVIATATATKHDYR